MKLSLHAWLNSEWFHAREWRKKATPAALEAVRKQALTARFTDEVDEPPTDVAATPAKRFFSGLPAKPKQNGKYFDLPKRETPTGKYFVIPKEG